MGGAEEKELFDQIYPHREELITIGNWNDFAMEHQLPPSEVIKSVFGSWNEVLEKFGVYVREPHEELKEKYIQIAQEHKEHFTTIPHWNEYAKENNLPSSDKYIYIFNGNWNAVKKELDFPLINAGFTKEELREIAEEHKSHFTSISTWNEYAKEHDLPSSEIFIKHYRSWNAVKLQLGIISKIPKRRTNKKVKKNK